MTALPSSRRTYRWIPAVLFALLACFVPGAADSVRAGGEKVVVLTVRGPITPSVAEYIERGFDEGRLLGASTILIELDTPGGLDRSMRSINRQILNSRVPVVVYVAPAGARAASAGAFITLAADVAAMSPGTTIGAAHPVSLVGKTDETMAGKVVNDSAAYIRSLAERHGRNGDWAERAVRESVSLTEQGALEENVVDIVAGSLEELLREIDGREVEREGDRMTINTREAPITRVPMDVRRRILNTLSDPNIAYLLLMLGMLGIFFELSNPGSIYPGVIGAFAIILALYGLQTLPVNYAGLLLLVLAGALLFAETQVPGFGVLALGGILALFVGSLMLVRGPAPWLRISLSVIVPVVAATVFFFLVVLQRIISTQRRRPSTGAEGLLGEVGEVVEDCAPRGRIFIRGELWDAECPAGAVKKDPVRVVSVQGLTLTVRKEENGG